MRINNNLMAMNTHRQLGAAGANGAKSMEKLSSGMRINRAGDDAAGLSISEKMRGQIRGLKQASSNSQDGISMIQTAEGALNETQAILQRMRELAVQSSNDTNVDKDREAIQGEMDELAKEITRIANNTEFNTQKLINGGIDDTGIKSAKFHVGANSNQDISLSIKAMDAKSLGVSRDVVTGATATPASGGSEQIASATFTGSDFGAGVVNGAVVDVDFTAAVVADAGSVSTLTGANFNAGSLAVNGETMTFTVGTDTYTLDTTSWDNSAGYQTLDDAITFLGSATDGGTGTLADVANITHDGSKLTIALKNPGDTDLTINIADSAGDGTGQTAVLNVFGFADAATHTGNTVVQGASAKIDLVSSLGHRQTATVSDPTATSLSITDGNFKGMNITMKASQTLANVHDDDAVTIATESSVAAAASFSNNSLVNEAVTEAGIDVSTQSAASKAVTTIQTAIETVSAERSKLGATQNRLEHTIKNLDTSSENLQAAESRIRDVDMAKEMMEFTKNNILQQAAQAMLAQANQAPQGVLQLLR